MEHFIFNTPNSGINFPQITHRNVSYSRMEFHVDTTSITFNYIDFFYETKKLRRTFFEIAKLTLYYNKGKILVNSTLYIRLS